MSAIKRPVQIEEFIVTLREVQDSELYSIKQQLEKSISKLHKTNGKLTKLINKEALNDESDDSDDELNELDQNDEKLFKEIIEENGIVANNQQERIEAIDNELTHRGLPHNITDGVPTKATENGKPVVEVDGKLKEKNQINTDNGVESANSISL
ncbi:Translation machinery-associated protein 17 [Wickerhamomyces ciferrii]|uniref:Translation machinery-associated protein 17 n=1 Tax=Wickerhamomyces ciferrii (strain ATCC 14091 / BCRC 22168 / CBS 111 / JCM 3599 / NBRC 0793 / NRRL Y-1031 F-60-10) TaxID=1206466 RepID=K0KEG9_WICCF|nr:Translation machinery-associated protein 17 [Wickerhamomyces ciferrii]CCH41296.1 Translation machinery-associated protein 17 [Wickerhamomyces ciferrii]